MGGGWDTRTRVDDRLFGEATNIQGIQHVLPFHDGFTCYVRAKRYESRRRMLREMEELMNTSYVCRSFQYVEEFTGSSFSRDISYVGYTGYVGRFDVRNKSERDI